MWWSRVRPGSSKCTKWLQTHRPTLRKSVGATKPLGNSTLPISSTRLARPSWPSNPRTVPAAFWPPAANCSKTHRRRRIGAELTCCLKNNANQAPPCNVVNGHRGTRMKIALVFVLLAITVGCCTDGYRYRYESRRVREEVREEMQRAREEVRRSLREARDDLRRSREDWRRRREDWRHSSDDVRREVRRSMDDVRDTLRD